MELIDKEMKWYVLQAYSGYENKVKQSLEDMIKREGIGEFFWRNFSSNRRSFRN